MAKNYSRSYDLSGLKDQAETNAEGREREYLYAIFEDEFLEVSWTGDFYRGRVVLWVNLNTPEHHRYLGYIKDICRDLHLELKTKEYSDKL